MLTALPTPPGRPSTVDPTVDETVLLPRYGLRLTVKIRWTAPKIEWLEYGSNKTCVGPALGVGALGEGLGGVSLHRGEGGECVQTLHAATDSSLGPVENSHNPAMSKQPHFQIKKKPLKRRKPPHRNGQSCDANTPFPRAGAGPAGLGGGGRRNPEGDPGEVARSCTPAGVVGIRDADTAQAGARVGAAGAPVTAGGGAGRHGHQGRPTERARTAVPPRTTRLCSRLPESEPRSHPTLWGALDAAVTLVGRRTHEPRSVQTTERPRGSATRGAV